MCHSAITSIEFWPQNKIYICRSSRWAFLCGPSPTRFRTAHLLSNRRLKDKRKYYYKIGTRRMRGVRSRNTLRLHRPRWRSPSAPPQSHGQGLHCKGYHHVCLHDALSPLFARLAGIHDRLDDPVSDEEREETDGFHHRELAPDACARAWPGSDVTVSLL